MRQKVKDILPSRTFQHGILFILFILSKISAVCRLVHFPPTDIKCDTVRKISLPSETAGVA